MTAADLATYAKALAAGELFQNPETLKEMLVFDPSAKFVVASPMDWDWRLRRRWVSMGARRPNAGIPIAVVYQSGKGCESLA